MSTPFDLPDRFWNKIDKRGPDECWPWRTVAYRNGYGAFYWNGKIIKAARFILMSQGHNMTGLVARHTCDYPPCCNPKHIIPGTRSENNRDASSRNRWTQGAKGSKSHLAKLDEAKVTEIRALWHAIPKLPNGWIGPHFSAAISNRYRISRRTLNGIVRRESWKHVP